MCKGVQAWWALFGTLGRNSTYTGRAERRLSGCQGIEGLGGGSCPGEEGGGERCVFLRTLEGSEMGESRQDLEKKEGYSR